MASRCHLCLISTLMVCVLLQQPLRLVNNDNSPSSVFQTQIPVTHVEVAAERKSGCGEASSNQTPPLSKIRG